MKDEIDIILMFGEISHHHLFQISSWISNQTKTHNLKRYIQ
jgi:hypothetical protein